MFFSSKKDRDVTKYARAYLQVIDDLRDPPNWHNYYTCKNKFEKIFNEARGNIQQWKYFYDDTDVLSMTSDNQPPYVGKFYQQSIINSLYKYHGSPTCIGKN